MKFKHIVVATDLTDNSRAALEAALDLAEAVGGRVTLVFVLEPTPSPPGMEALALEGLPVDWASRIQEAQAQAAMGRLGATAAEHRRAPAVIETELLSGLLPEMLTEYLAKVHADLLVVGSHGRRGAAHFFIGSVAEELMRHAPCPVLVVKPTPAS